MRDANRVKPDLLMTASTNADRGSKHRNAGVDLVRGISISLVLLNHLTLRIPLMKTGLVKILPKALLIGLSWDGYEAVFVFFVVSGFLITRNIIQRSAGLPRVDLWAFYVRRAARILPCLVLLVAVLCLLDLAKVPYYTILRPVQSLPRAVLAVFCLRLNLYEGRTGYLPGGWDVLWSLSIEEIFYIGFPLVCILAGRIKLLFSLLFLAFGLLLPIFLNALSQAPEIWQEKAYLPGMSAIAMGVFAAQMVVAVRAPSPKTVAVMGWLSTILLAVFFCWESSFYSVIGNATMLVLTGSVGLLLAAFHWGWGAGWTMRGTGWLRSFGVMSYEIYLTHMFIVFLIVGLYGLAGSPVRFGWVWFVPAFGLAWALGLLVTKCYSWPIDRWVRARRNV